MPTAYKVVRITREEYREMARELLCLPTSNLEMARLPGYREYDATAKIREILTRYGCAGYPYFTVNEKPMDFEGTVRWFIIVCNHDTLSTLTPLQLTHAAKHAVRQEPSITRRGSTKAA